MDHRTRLLESLFESLIELSPDERRKRLDAECSDSELRTELEELLRHHDADSHQPDFLDALKITTLDSRHVDAFDSEQSNEPQQIGPYRVIEKIGVGGMGTVYRVEHQRLRKHFALKLLPLAATARPDLVSRFQREMEGVGKLDHENVVRASDAGEIDGRHYLVMELVDGATVEDLVKRHGPLAIADACEVIRQAAAGLQHAHSQGLIHRDIKPSNLMVTKQGGLKIVDFGLALLSDSSSSAVTHAGSVMGTVDYMSPEQATQSHDVDETTDVYSLGATLFKLLTGTAPLEDSPYETLAQKLLALTDSTILPINTRREDLPESLARFIDRMLTRDPVGRPSSAGEVVATMSEFCVGTDLARLVAKDSVVPGVTADIRSPAEARRFHASRQTLWAIAIALSVVVVLLVFLMPYGGDTGTGEAETELQSLDATDLPAWRPSGRAIPATRSVAAWPYLYHVATKPLAELRPTIAMLFQFCDEQQFEVTNDAVTLAYLDMSEEDLSGTSTIEIRIRLFERPDVLPADLRKAAQEFGLYGVGIRSAAPGAEAYLTKRKGIDNDESAQLWRTLYEFALKETALVAYSAPMERISVAGWDTIEDYENVETELIVPLE